MGLSKTELLEVLSREGGDNEADHARAEEALLSFVNDEEIIAAWKDAKDRQNWWYS